jgi:Cu2+-exporting ATPase
MDSIIVLSRKVAEQGIRPAVDLNLTNSSLLTPEIVGERHYMLSVKVQALLQKYGLSKHKIVTKNTIAYVIEENDIIGSIEIGDQLRDSSLQAVKTLQDMNIAVAMVTGDNEAVAQDVAKKLGIERVYAGVLPGEKSRIVKDLQGEGNIVLFTGDGVNDSPALAQANVGVAIGAGTDVAIESAGILLVGSDPLQVANSIKLSRATYRKMRENLLWGAGYNVVALPLAAGLFAFAGLSLSPAAGAVVMSLSTIIVALNAQTLRRFGK